MHQKVCFQYGILTLRKKPDILQGQIEATEIRISGKLPGRIDRFLDIGSVATEISTVVLVDTREVAAVHIGGGCHCVLCLLYTSRCV